MTLLLCLAGLNIAQKTSQRYDTVTMSGWFNLVQKTIQRDDTVTLSGWFTLSRRQVKDMTLLLCHAGLNIVQKTSQGDDTVTVSGWIEHCPEDKSKI